MPVDKIAGIMVNKIVQLRLSVKNKLKKSWKHKTNSDKQIAMIKFITNPAVAML